MESLRRQLYSFAIACFSLALAATALAQERDTSGSEPEAAAQQEPQPVEPSGYRELVDEALGEYDAGHYEESRALLRRAHGLFPNARSYRGLGMAEFELRHYPEAIRALEAALASNVRPLDDKLRAATELLLARSRGFVGRVFVETEPSQSRVFIDGIPANGGPTTPAVLSVGDHLIEVEAEGYAAVQRSIRLQGGETETLVISLRAAPPLGEAPTGARSRRWYKSAWLWSAVAFVGAGAAAGAAVALSRDHGRSEAGYAGTSGVSGRAP
ncbi:MAG: hypothetical protein JWN48_2575 [Myxococcaceae bacterium]|nr:hypothetical protein [Myxococcaceae bacterium]